MLRAVFMGSPAFAVPSLSMLLEHHEVALVVTQSDKRAGRGQRLVSPIVKQVAEQSGVSVLQPTSVRGEVFAQTLRDTKADVGIVVAYGKILPLAVLQSFPLGCINVHASILPKYRGAAPVQWALIHGETHTGVSIMQLDVGMDTGPVFGTSVVPIAAHDTSGSLLQRLAAVGAEALREILGKMEEKSILPVPQKEEEASYAPMLTTADGVLDWTQSATAIANRVRGVDPWPSARTTWQGLSLKLFRGEATEGKGTPGEVIRADRQGLVVACSQGACKFLEIQAQGRKRMLVSDFIAGRTIAPGTVLGA